jgi:hypothetical protein
LIIREAVTHDDHALGGDLIFFNIFSGSQRLNRSAGLLNSS